jgi:hypothetical protein
MRTTTSGTGRITGPTRTHFTTTGFIATIVGKWREYRMIRDFESLPYTVMKDIGFRAE